MAAEAWCRWALCACLCLLSAAGVAEGQPAVPFARSFGFVPDLVEVDQQGDYDLIRYGGAHPDGGLERIGAPSLPVFEWHIVLPPDCFIDTVAVSILDTQSLAGEYLPIPIQDPASEEFTLPDPQYYQSEEPFPQVPVLRVVDTYMKGIHVAVIQAWPLQFTGATGTLSVLTDLHVEVHVRPMTDSERQATFRPARAYVTPWEKRPEVKWLRKHSLNPEYLAGLFQPDPGGPIGPRTQSVEEENPFGGFVPSEYPSLEGPPVQMVIITDDVRRDGSAVSGLVEEFEDWAAWKTLKGVPTAVKTVTWIDSTYTGVDTPEKIRNFLRDAATYWATEFVMLGGDLEIVPTRLLGGERGVLGGQLTGRADPPADSYYSEFDVGWNENEDAYFGEQHSDLSGTVYADAWVGRVPVRAAWEAEDYFAKVSSFEGRPGYSVPTGESFYESILLAAGPTNSFCSDENNGIWVAEDIAATVDGSAFDMSITRMYPPIPTTISWPCSLGSPQVRCFQVMTDEVMTEDPDVNYTRANFLAELEEAPLFAFHIEHSARDRLGGVTLPEYAGESGCGICSTFAWASNCLSSLDSWLDTNCAGWDEPITLPLADDLTNAAHEYSIVVSRGSNTDRFDMDCIGEHLLRNPLGGAVAYFGKIQSAEADGPPRVFFESVFEDSVVNVGAVAALAGQSILGSTGPTMGGIAYRLLGDPEMPVWAGTPGELRLTQDPGYITSLGPQTITIRVRDDNTLAAIEGARVCA